MLKWVNAYLHVCDTSVSLSGVREEEPPCNKHGMLLGTRHKAPCSSNHGVDRIVGTSATRPASSVLGVASCLGWAEGVVICKVKYVILGLRMMLMGPGTILPGHPTMCAHG